MSLLTVITAAIVLFGVLGRDGYGRALALGGATPAGAALVSGSTSVPTFYAVALGALAAVGVAALRRLSRGTRVPPIPGMPLLVAFFLWVVLLTLGAPLLFDGQPIVTTKATQLVAGVVTSANVAQVTYLLLGIVVVVLIARSPSSRVQLLGLAGGTCTLLSFWRYGHQVAGVPFPDGLFDNSGSFVFIQTAAGGINRFRGILSEPSSLAGTSLVTIAYMLARAGQVGGSRRLAALVLAGIALFLGVYSTSTTFVVAGLISTGVIGAASLLGFLARRQVLSRGLAALGCIAVVALVLFAPTLLHFVTGAVDHKLVSASYSARSSADSDSFKVFLDTWGVGVGLGAARGSSFFPTLLSGTGLIGTLLFFGAVLTLLHRGGADPRMRPVVWTLVTLLITKFVAGPDLDDTSGILWISLGLLAHAALHTQPPGVPRLPQRELAAVPA